MQERQNELEIRRITQELSQSSLSKSTGHSEPTTPPEFKDMTFPERRNRNGYMAGSLLSTPPSMPRHETATHQLMTPPAEDILPIFGQKTPSKSVPNSRRNSDENEFSTQQDEPNLGQRLLNARYHHYSQSTSRTEVLLTSNYIEPRAAMPLGLLRITHRKQALPCSTFFLTRIQKGLDPARLLNQQHLQALRVIFR